MLYYSQMSRQKIIAQLADRLGALQRPHPVRVAITGIDAAGKTTLADELASALTSAGRVVIRASIDGFQRPRAERYRRGDVSALGYYEDAFDYAALKAALLLPLGPGGNRSYRRAVFDTRSDTPLWMPAEEAPPNALLLFDGVFLLRPEIADLWEYVIFVKIDFETGLQRALQRDLPVFGSGEVIQQRYHQRYYPGQRLYFEQARPEQCANAIVDNNDVLVPRLIFCDEELP
jgi:uridine kinase